VGLVEIHATCSSPRILVLGRGGGGHQERRKQGKYPFSFGFVLNRGLVYIIHE